MPVHNLFRVFTDRLNSAGLRYAVTGSVAAIVYGEPRLTHDVDLVLALRSRDACSIVESFPSADFYCPPLEVIQMETRRSERGHFNLIDDATGFKADVYLAGADPFDRWAVDNRRRIDFEGEPFWIAPPEFVIVKKLLYFREGGSQKHIHDIRSILDVSGEKLDHDELNSRISAFGLEQVWSQFN